MTRLRHWTVAGALLPVVTIGGLAVLVSFGQGLDSAPSALGAALLAVLMVTLPCAGVATAVGWGVLAVARRLPERGSPRRRRAVLRAAGACSALGTVVGAALLPFSSGEGATVPAVVAHGVVFVVLPTAAALLTWSRHPAPAGLPEGAVPGP